MAAKPDRKLKVVADNRRARFNYEIGETFKAGIALTGTEVKALRQGKATIAESYADSRGNELWLVNANIPEYLQGGRFNHAPKRPRKLLLHRRQMDKLAGAVDREGMTIVPLIPKELSVANWYLLCSFASSVLVSRVLGLTFEIDPEERSIKDE